MPLEAATSLEQLQDTWPLGGDSLNKGDDHVRLIKQVLKTQFPGVDLNGFKIPITATEDELNFLSGVTTPIQTQFDDLGVRVSANEDAIANLIEAGTKMVFYQAAAPTGWTLDTAITDHVMRIVEGTILAGGVTGGTDDPVLNDKVAAHTHTAASAGAHTHPVVGNYMNQQPGGDRTIATGGTNDWENPTTSSAGDHTHSVEENAGASDWTPRFANMIVCTKN